MSPFDARCLLINLHWPACCLDSSYDANHTQDDVLRPDREDAIQLAAIVNEISKPRVLRELTIAFQAHNESNNGCVEFNFAWLDMEAIAGSNLEKLVFDVRPCRADFFHEKLISSFIDQFKRVRAGVFGNEPSVRADSQIMGGNYETGRIRFIITPR
ncbi:hypothetical protein EK21DRAFT_107895 [Setomelanomma holmii]|uniref:Uncharacterized protein n=1 Tax=Setomelanomma holmii TaxID=210430 RepID=A0A9P4HHX9_9PLEO|nr:hypothetical protein EK21DRAFT_107895 [Setomelanomma holmii]